MAGGKYVKIMHGFSTPPLILTEALCLAGIFDFYIRIKPLFMPRTEKPVMQIF